MWAVESDSDINESVNPSDFGFAKNHQNLTALGFEHNRIPN